MENEQKTTKIRWEGNRAFVGKVCVASMDFDLMPQVWKIAIDRKIASLYLPETEARAWVERYLGVEEEVAGNVEDPKPGIEWIDGEGFVDGVFRATVEESAITHTNAGEKREKPLFRAFVIREDGVQSKAANCLDESAAKRWCERMILGEG